MKDKIQGLIKLINEMCDECERISGQWDGNDSGALEDIAREHEDIKFWLEMATEDLIKARDSEEEDFKANKPNLDNLFPDILNQLTNLKIK